jgi:hypothetical protein
VSGDGPRIRPRAESEFTALLQLKSAHAFVRRYRYDGQSILDGRNRYRACLAAGIEPTFTVYQSDDPVSYVISLKRRHLDESQRAMVAAKLATQRGNFPNWI